MVKIVIICSGGLVQDVYDSEKVEVEIIDHDDLREEMTGAEADAHGAKAVEGLEHVY